MVNAQNFVADATTKWDNSYEYIMEIAEIMPDELYDFRPTGEEMSFQEQLIHMAGNMVRLSHAYLSFSELEPPERIKAENADPSEVKQYLKAAYSFSRSAIESQDETSLNKMANNFFAGPKSRRQIIFLMNDHLAHHRGQVIVYLRLNQLKPPSYKGW
ncbi:hypothetical protein GCM10025777_11660 [Membranihabitans marinus]